MTYPYGRPYRRRRAVLIGMLQPGIPCPRCRWPMFKSADQAAAHGAPRWLSELDVDHVQRVAFGGAGGDSVLAHARCNRAGGQAITAAILRRRADR